MKLEDISLTYHIPEDQRVILKTNCSQFISSTKQPLYKTLKTITSPVSRIKVRLRKNRNIVTELFNAALASRYHCPNIHQRSVFASGSRRADQLSDDVETVYVFPINGFKYLYNELIENSAEHYRETFYELFNVLHDDEQSQSIVKKLMLYTYRCDNLDEGIGNGSEIIMYNIPFYYALKVSTFPNYNQLIDNIIR